jgi:sugar lactone lactonase YvrE
LHYVHLIFITSNDILYIADSDNNRIVIVQLDNMISVSTFGSGPGTGINQFNYPSDVFVTDTAIYIMDTDNERIQKWSTNGTNPSTMPGSGAFTKSYYLFFDIYGNLYVSNCDQNTVVRLMPNSSTPVIVAGNATAGTAANELSCPYGIFVDDAQTIYIADYNNHRIQKWIYRASSGITVAGNGTSGNSLVQLDNPESLVVDTNGYMYIADTYNHRIVRWAPNATTGICIIACTGTLHGFQADQLDHPVYLAFDSNSSMYISDQKNNRVQKFQIHNNTSECPIINDKVDTIKGFFRSKYTTNANDTKTNNIQKLTHYLTSIIDR